MDNGIGVPLSVCGLGWLGWHVPSRTRPKLAAGAGCKKQCDTGARQREGVRRQLGARHRRAAAPWDQPRERHYAAFGSGFQPLELIKSPLEAVASQYT
jgi:hypothetical protein